MIGRSLAQYRITASIGAGGMGEEEMGSTVYFLYLEIAPGKRSR